MKKLLETTKIFSRLYLKLSTHSGGQKVSYVYGKEILVVPDKFFMFRIQNNWS